MIKKVDDNHIFYIDVLRVISCFLVIVNHCHGLMLDGKSQNALFYCLTFPICKIAVPIFLMITGILILKKEYNYKKVLKSINRIFIPLIIISFFVYAKNVGIKEINLFCFFKAFIKEPYVSAFWYLYLLVGIYIVIPFIQKMVKSFNSYDYIFFIIIFLIIPSIVNLISIYFNFKFNENFMLTFFSAAIAFLVAGNYIEKLKLKKSFFIIAILMFIISYIFMTLSMYLPFYEKGEISYNMDSWNSLPVILMSLSFLYAIKYVLNELGSSSNMISMLASTSFGIYLIHLILNHRIYNMDIFQKLFSVSRVISTIILEIVVFLICFIIIYILKKIPIIKRFL